MFHLFFKKIVVQVSIEKVPWWRDLSFIPFLRAFIPK
jgi:hypothetical protein